MLHCKLLNLWSLSLERSSRFYHLGEKQDDMLMMKVDGKDGYEPIFGDESSKPIEGYNTEILVNAKKYYCVTDPKISLDIVFQKIFTLHGLHDLGLVYGDGKIENVMIQKENGEYTVRHIRLLQRDS